MRTMEKTAFPRWHSGKESNCRCKRRGFNPWVRKIPWRIQWQPTPVFLPRESHGQRSLASYSPWCRKRIGYDLATEPQQQPVVRTWYFHCWGLGSVPGQGTAKSHHLLLSPLRGPQLDLPIRSYLFSFTNYV